MSVRYVAVVTLAAALGLAAPALARPAAKAVAGKSVAVRTAVPRGIDPAGVLAGSAGHGFSDRTARLTSIMGQETGVVRMQIPLRPEHPRGLRREADASAGLR